MQSVGILTSNEKWVESLEQSIGKREFSISGWISPDGNTNGAFDRLLDQSSVIWIPEKLNGSMDEAIRTLRKSKHLLLGFPVVDFVGEAFHLLKLAQEAHVKVQVGHNERYHPALRSCLPLINQPRTIYAKHFIEGQPDSKEPPWFLKEMVSDLSLILPILSSTEKKIKAHATFFGDHIPLTIDIRIDLHNGTMASLQYRSMACSTIRSIEVIQEESILEIDLHSGHSQRNRIPDTEQQNTATPEVIWDSFTDQESDDASEVEFENQLTQCLSFLHTLDQNHIPVSPLEDGFHALEVAEEIQNQILRY